MLSAFVSRTIKRGADGGAASTSGPMTRTASSAECASDYTKGEAAGFSVQELAASASGLLLAVDTLHSLYKRRSKGTGRAA